MKGHEPTLERLPWLQPRRSPRCYRYCAGCREELGPTASFEELDQLAADRGWATLHSLPCCPKCQNPAVFNPLVRARAPRIPTSRMPATNRRARSFPSGMP